MLRRLEKRVLVDLPSKDARQAMFQQFLPPTVIRESNGLVLFSDLDYGQLSNVCLFHYLFHYLFFLSFILVHRRLFRCRY
jgi:SpoVK/Ycf46/Vps4 family AAA+-type ATPase